jgi:4-hydroxybenzoate polyprenyltransferase
LKELYFYKNATSGAGFMITVFGYPLATQYWGETPYGFPPGITWTTVLFSAVFFFLFIQSYEIIYDLRDIKGDTLGGIRTYPMVHGERFAAHIIDGLIFSSMAVLIVGYLLNIVPWRIVIMAAAPLVQLYVYKRGLKRGISAKDCILLTWLGATMMTIYHLWVVAGLPGSGF